MHISEYRPKSTRVDKLKNRTMFIFKDKLFLYVQENPVPKFLELENGVWVDNRTAFHLNEEVNQIAIDTIIYRKVSTTSYYVSVEE